MPAKPSYKKLSDKGEIVFKNTWEESSGAFGKYVYKLDDLYYTYDMEEEAVDGPYDIIDDALDDDMLTVSSVTVEVSSTELSFEDLVSLLIPEGYIDAESIDVNGLWWPPEDVEE
jgi:hypothetical protein